MKPNALVKNRKIKKKVEELTMISILYYKFSFSKKLQKREYETDDIWAEQKFLLWIFQDFFG